MFLTKVISHEDLDLRTPSPSPSPGIKKSRSSSFLEIGSSTKAISQEDGSNLFLKPELDHGLFYLFPDVNPEGLEPSFPDPKPKEPMLCDDCTTVHIPYPYDSCPSKSCIVCYKQGHNYVNCPYYYYIPQGADFNWAQNQVICQCGRPFDTDRWVCTYCTWTKAKLKEKSCTLCGSDSDHTEFECPANEELSAKYKSDWASICAEHNKYRS